MDPKLPTPPRSHGKDVTRTSETSTSHQIQTPPKKPIQTTPSTTTLAPSTPQTRPKSQVTSPFSPPRQMIIYPALVEFCRRNNQFILQMNEDKWNELRDNAVEDTSSFNTSVSFLGKTQNGKSTLIRDLLRSIGQSDFVPNIAQGVMQSQPTSNGISPFRVVDEQNHTTYYLDYEGEDGGLTPVDDTSSDQMDETLARARRDITRTDLRRFAYVTSNVIVYLTASPFSNIQASCYDILDFASEAVNAIGSAERPSLLIIFNKQSLGGDLDGPVTEEELSRKLNCESFTEEFFSAHDPDRNLLNYFYEVKAIVIPMQRMILDCVNGEGEIFEINTTDLKNQQVNKSIEVIDQMITNKWKERHSKGNLYNEATWLVLMQLVLSRFYVVPEDNNKNYVIAPIRMSNVLVETLITDKNSKYLHESMRVLQEVSDAYFTQCLSLSPLLQGYTRQRESILNLCPTTIQMSSKVDEIIQNPNRERVRRYQQNFRWALYSLVLATIHQSADVCADAAILRSDIYTRMELWPHISQLIAELSTLWEKYYRPCLSHLDSEDSYHSPICCDQVAYNHCDSKHHSDLRLIVRKSNSVVSRFARTIRQYIFRQSTREIAQETTIKIVDAIWSKSPHEEILPPISNELYPEIENFYHTVMNSLRANKKIAYSLLLAYQALVTHEAYEDYPLPCLSYLSCQREIKVCLMCLRPYKHVTKTILSCDHTLCSDCFGILTDHAATNSIPIIWNLQLSDSRSTFMNCFEKCPFCRKSI